jgi:metal transporter CNNM
VNIWLIILIVLLLIGVSAVCSGLNVALMSLSLDDLRRKRKLGNARAEKVYPFRKNAHLSLAAILLTNVAAVSATSLVLESVLYGLFAGLITTISIVIFGEIFLFEQQESELHTRQELGIMINEHLHHEASELDEDEVEIIRGALQLSEKRVSDIMLPISHVYWLTVDTALTPEKIDEIKEVGRSRIPVFDRKLTRCYGMLLMKDLVDIDFDDNEFRVDDLSLYPVQMVGSRTALDTMLRKFISSGTHLIPVEKDDEIVGIVTIEDLIEEIVGHEIEDETDRNRKQTQTKIAEQAESS